MKGLYHLAESKKSTVRKQEEQMNNSKPYIIPKRTVFEAYKKAKANKCSAGIDGQDFEAFDENLSANLYKIWNRMSSGTYFPPPVKMVEIPKKNGGTRTLGIPTVSDRIAQTVVKYYLESSLEPIFHKDSYGYRSNRSALDAVGQARTRCWKYDYVLEFDIKGLFDNIPHDLLMVAVHKHIKEDWLILYIERWLKTPFVNRNGEEVKRESGTPQGGVVSPVLANLFMHYAFDKWMDIYFPKSPFERYADDAIIHCKSEIECRNILESLDRRLKQCGLELHPDKTKIVYCSDKDRKCTYPVTSFDFLGYTFKKRFIKDRTGRLQFNFLPAVSKQSEKAFRTKLKNLQIHKMTGSTIQIISQIINPIVRGWINYFGRYNRSQLKSSLDVLNRRLVKWATRKYKRFRGHPKRAREWLIEVAKREPNMFPHWTLKLMP